MGRRAISPLDQLGIGSQLRLHRRQAGLTQLELARQMGTSQAVVARMEKGGHVNLSTVARALSVLGLQGSTHLFHDRPDDRGTETDWLFVRVDLIRGRGEELDPPAGRSFVVSPRHTLAELGHAIDVAFGRWDHAHMHSFHFRWQGEYLPAEGGWDTPTDSLSTTIGTLKLRQGDPFVYIFDLGDGHTHYGVVEHTRVDPTRHVGYVPDRPVPIWGWGAIPDQYGRRWADDPGEEHPIPSREQLLRSYRRDGRSPQLDRLPRLPLLDSDAREALLWPAEEALGGRELAAWDRINGLREKLARSMPLVSSDGSWRVTHVWQAGDFPAAQRACVVCGGEARPMGASAAAWQASRDLPWLRDGMVCESCLKRRQPAMLAFLQELEAPPGGNELADALTIWIEARGGARAVTGEAREPTDLAGRAERLLAICRALSEGLVQSNEGRPERLRQAIDEILAASPELPSSDDEMLAGWLRLADDALRAGRGPEHSLVNSLANRRREAAARYEMVLRKLR